MYYIIETKNQLSYLIGNSENECYISVITNNDNFHPYLTTPSLVYFHPKNDKSYIICLNHSEGLNQLSINDVVILLEKYQKIWCYDKKFHLYFLPESLPIFDVNFLTLEDNNTYYQSDIFTKAQDIFYRKNPTYELLNQLIPISKHFEREEQISQNIPQLNINWDYYNKISSVFYNIEKNGIKINIDKFQKHFDPSNEQYFIKEGKVYTNYLLYNTTMRPTNAFNSINFAALPHDTRESFIPENDLFLELDYDGYHLRLISHIINYDLTGEPAHKQLACLYFGTPHPTKDQIELAKKTTFSLLYGGIQDQYLSIPYFKKIDEYCTKIWNDFNTNGYIELYGGKKLKNIKNPNKAKLLNYIIQSMETYNNVEVLYDMIIKLKNKKTKLVHYTYDAILLDVDISEIDLVEELKNIMEKNFPVKISYGKNYKDMEKIQNLQYLSLNNKEFE